MLPISVGTTSFKYGPWEIPYADVTAAGVGVQQRRFQTYRSLLIGYRLPDDARHRKILFRLTPGAQGEQLVQAFQAHVADRWKGEAPYFEMNKRLGFSNKAVFAIVAAIVVVTAVSVVGWAVSLKHADPDPRRPDTTTRTPRR